MSMTIPGFTVHYLGEAALTSLRHRLRDTLREAGAPVSMGHAAEAVASALGAASHAAMLAGLRQDGGRAYDAPFDEHALMARLTALTGVDREVVAPAVLRFVGMSMLARELGMAPACEGIDPSGADALPAINWCWTGRMITHSKSSYLRRFAANLVVFNAQVFTRGAGQIWVGDLDVTRDTPQIQALADRLGEDVFVLRETAGLAADGRPLPDLAVASFRPNR